MAAAVIAVTGDVGAGKSTVSRLLEAMGGVRFDADKIALSLWERGDIIEAAVRRWGTEILDSEGGIIRAAVAGKIFSSQAEYAWCCGLLHPHVMTELGRQVAGLARSQWAVAEIPLLFEVGRPQWVTSVFYVTAPQDVRLRRCEERGWDEAELRRRENFYLPSGERMKLSDFIIHNGGDRPSLEAELRKITAAIFLRKP